MGKIVYLFVEYNAIGVIMMWRFVKNFYEKCFVPFWYFRGRIPLLNLPLPTILPFGGLFLLYPDEMGLNLFLQSLKSHYYEEGKCRFILGFVKQGMICFDMVPIRGFIRSYFQSSQEKQVRCLALNQ
jgi:hypothetical protein